MTTTDADDRTSPARIRELAVALFVPGVALPVAEAAKRIVGLCHRWHENEVRNYLLAMVADGALGFDAKMDIQKGATDGQH
jgi:hypothetical protein